MLTHSEKEDGKLTVDQFRQLIQKLPEVRREMREVQELVRGRSEEWFKEFFGEEAAWASIYEWSLAEQIAWLILALGRRAKLMEMGESSDPQEALLTWSKTDELDDWKGGEWGIFEKKHILGLVVALQRNILSIMLYARSMGALVEEVRQGEDDSLFLAVRVDRTVVACPPIADRIAQGGTEERNQVFPETPERPQRTV